jgi:hypothetical protein
MSDLVDCGCDHACYCEEISILEERLEWIEDEISDRSVPESCGGRGGPDSSVRIRQLQEEFNDKLHKLHKLHKLA